VNPRVLLAMGLLLCAAPSLAGMYKWVDDKGVTHYSESPPPGRKAQQVQTAPSAPSATPTPAEPASTWGDKERAFRQRSIEREQAEEARKKKEAAEKYQAAMRRERCIASQSALRTLNEQRPVYRINEQGAREYIADADRPGAIERAKQNIETYCKPE
jgi:hypothetical protein